MTHGHEYDPTLQSPAERRSLLSQGVQRLRRLFVQVANITTLRTDTITERTSGAGVTIDSVLLKDGAVYVPTATDNVSSPPTDAELDTAFGQPSALGDGFIGLLDDNGAGTTVWLCQVINSAWWYEGLTKAT